MSVLTTVEDDVLVITINRPHVRNAIDRATALSISAAIDELDNTAALRVGILTGEGRTFCSGMDLRAFTDGEVMDHGDRGFGGITERPPLKLMIAAVEGHAIAGGFEIALACDLIVAGEDAVFALPEVRRGLIAGGGGLLRLPLRLPVNVAMELAVTGAPMAAERAHQLGLVNVLCPPAGALEAARALARTICENAPLAVQESKRVLLDSVGDPLADAFEKQGEAARRLAASEDAREGARAFVEKRSPRWTCS